VIKLRFLPAAEAELLKEVAYYSNVRDGLGIKFEYAVEIAVSNAVSNPSGGSPSPKCTRSRLVKGFPFSVVYRASDTEILVVAVMNHRRQPGYWADRIA
jgi:plasmid stabilization system protein ParE